MASRPCGTLTSLGETENSGSKPCAETETHSNGIIYLARGAGRWIANFSERVLDLGERIVDVAERKLYTLYTDPQKEPANGARKEESCIIVRCPVAIKCTRYKVNRRRTGMSLWKHSKQECVEEYILKTCEKNAPGNVNRRRAGMIPWKHSKQECVEGFILRVTDSTLYESRTLEKKNFKSARNLSFQPLTVVIESVDELTHCLVVIDNVKYDFDFFCQVYGYE
ncbi:unnamed protein product [Bemisia tabaci]|uniref:Uncharacterized protein n=1 Tax=Bemisia tabaci TaxID=7038 RepID=A0A9P0AI53_BEMTA|nr:unnamed protein product [Bemisia tabaci]